MLKALAPGDVVTVTRIDRFARAAPTPAQQKEATRRRAQGATLDELARSYDVGISTIRRVTRACMSSATAPARSGF